MQDTQYINKISQVSTQDKIAHLQHNLMSYMSIQSYSHTVTVSVCHISVHDVYVFNV